MRTTTSYTISERCKYHHFIHSNRQNTTAIVLSAPSRLQRTQINNLSSHIKHHRLHSVFLFVSPDLLLLSHFQIFQYFSNVNLVAERSPVLDDKLKVKAGRVSEDPLNPLHVQPWATPCHSPPVAMVKLYRRPWSQKQSVLSRWATTSSEESPL